MSGRLLRPEDGLSVRSCLSASRGPRLRPGFHVLLARSRGPSLTNGPSRVPTHRLPWQSKPWHDVLAHEPSPAQRSAHKSFLFISPLRCLRFLSWMLPSGKPVESVLPEPTEGRLYSHYTGIDHLAIRRDILDQDFYRRFRRIIRDAHRSFQSLDSSNHFHGRTPRYRPGLDASAARSSSATRTSMSSSSIALAA
jgi:hypothetical protein